MNESRPVDTASARHYTWGAGCDGWHLLEHEALSVIRESMPAGTAETRHRHARARQFFYVLAGEARLELEGTQHALATGQGLHVPPGAAHRMCNDGPAVLELLVISAPKSHGDRQPAPDEEALA